METKQFNMSKPVYIYVDGYVRGNYRAAVIIGVQTFHLVEERTKKEAVWTCKMFKIAMQNAGIEAVMTRPVHDVACRCTQCDNPGNRLLWNKKKK